MAKDCFPECQCGGDGYVERGSPGAPFSYPCYHWDCRVPGCRCKAGRIADIDREIEELVQTPGEWTRPQLRHLGLLHAELESLVPAGGNAVSHFTVFGLRVPWWLGVRLYMHGWAALVPANEETAE